MSSTGDAEIVDIELIKDLNLKNVVVAIIVILREISFGERSLIQTVGFITSTMN
jgi:hypothetical protein